MADPVAAAYADCIHLPCPLCGATPDNWCRINGRDRAIPCVARYPKPSDQQSAFDDPTPRAWPPLGIEWEPCQLPPATPAYLEGTQR